MKYILLFFGLLLLNSCFKGEKVDMIIHNGRIHIMNDRLEIAEAVAILDGKIIEVGPERQIMNRYRADIVIDAGSRDVLPGFQDAHGHIMSFAKQKMNVDLRNTRSYFEVISRLEKHQSKTKQDVLIGRGWDQSLWGTENLPNDSLLNVTFPDTPVALTRIDGHAMLINKAMREYVGITDTTTVKGGQFNKENGVFTGILIEHALDFVNERLPKPKKEDLKKAILQIQDELLASGITHVHEAGLSAEDRDLFIEIATEKKWKINVYAMLFPTPENIHFAEENGHYKKGKLSIRSFKVVADGALGSYGACLIEPYSDQPSTHGMLLRTPQELQHIATVAKNLDYQLNTHCIGDSTNRTLLHIIDTLMRDEVDHRWRIEHAQIIHPDDIHLFSKTNTLPSTQPTHATSDQRWAEQRIGKERLSKGAYANNSLLKDRRMILFGTDFPIEDFNPFATIHAAVQRKNTEGEPQDGFLPEEKVTLNEALQAMTIWPAYGSFEESKEGTVERGKSATFVILDQPLQSSSHYLPNYSWITIIEGNTVFDMR